DQDLLPLLEQLLDLRRGPLMAPGAAPLAGGAAGRGSDRRHADADGVLGGLLVLEFLDRRDVLVLVPEPAAPAGPLLLVLVEGLAEVAGIEKGRLLEA